MSKIDLISGVLANLRLRSQLYFRADLAGAFAVEVPAQQRLVRFHFLRRGGCWVRGADGPAVPLTEGDLAILPNGAAQVLADTPDRQPQPLAAVLATAPPGSDGVLRYGEGSGRAELLCGFCQFDEEIEHPALAGLPALMVLRPQNLGREPWTLAALRLLSLECERAGQGMEGILTRLLEILFIQAIRQFGEETERESNGYLAALADPQLAKALEALHQDCQYDWTIAELARVAGMSRARFAERFRRLVGQAPIAYLTNWRLITARRLLRESDLSTEDIAARCGYSSLPAFTRRYKTAFGIGPGRFRRSARRR